MIRWVHGLRRGISGLATIGCGLLFPPRCASCDAELPDGDGECLLCADCLTRLVPPKRHACQRCAGDILDSGVNAQRCSLCRNTRLKFDAAVALGSYHAGLRDVVLRMKRPSHTALSVAMGRLLVRHRSEQLAERRADMVVPIPMYWTRRLRREINSPDILARCLSKSLGIPVRRGILTRCRNTLPQAHLPPARRLTNVQGAFRVRHPKAVKGASVLLIDDVLTTGATCSEAAKMLKRAGAARVIVAVIARAQGR